MWLFGQTEELASVVTYAQVIKARGKSFEYDGRHVYGQIVELG